MLHTLIIYYTLLLLLLQIVVVCLPLFGYAINGRWDILWYDMRNIQCPSVTSISYMLYYWITFALWYEQIWKHSLLSNHTFEVYIFNNNVASLN